MSIVCSMGTTVFSTTNSSICIFIHNEAISFEADSKPYVNEMGQTLVPFRFIAPYLDISIDWQTPSVIATGLHAQTGEEIEVIFYIGEHFFSIDGKKHFIDTPIELKNDRAYIPLRLLAETFGYYVMWDDGNIDICQGWTFDETFLYHDFELLVFELVNEERLKENLEPLALSQRLSEIARLKSEDMHENGYFEHESPFYGSPFEMIESFGIIDYKTAGENIAKGQKTAEAVVKAWMNSASHKANILKETYEYMGIGYHEEGKFWTQMFLGGSGMIDEMELATAVDTSLYGMQVLELVNLEREKEGLSALLYLKELEQVAQVKSEDMYQHLYFDHISPLYGSPMNMIRRFGFMDYAIVGENIAKGQKTPESVVAGWLLSETHRENILTENFQYMAIGLCEEEWIWTQLFLGNALNENKNFYE